MNSSLVCDDTGSDYIKAIRAGESLSNRPKVSHRPTGSIHSHLDPFWRASECNTNSVLKVYAKPEQLRPRQQQQQPKASLPIETCPRNELPQKRILPMENVYHGLMPQTSSTVEMGITVSTVTRQQSKRVSSYAQDSLQLGKTYLNSFRGRGRRRSPQRHDHLASN